MYNKKLIAFVIVIYALLSWFLLNFAFADTTTSGYTGITLPATTTGLKAATVATKDHIQFTVTPTFDSSLAPGEYDTIKVEAEYLSNQTTNEVIPQTKAGIKVSIDYTQVS